MAFNLSFWVTVYFFGHLISFKLFSFRVKILLGYLTNKFGWIMEMNVCLQECGHLIAIIYVILRFVFVIKYG